MHAAKIYAENYANAKKSQVDTAWRSHPSTANRAYQQPNGAARLFEARIPACTPPAHRPRAARTYQPAYNR